MSGSFTQKLINLSCTLTNGNFQGGGNTATLSGLRVQAKIVKAGDASMGSASIAVYGLPLSLMNQLTVFGLNATSTGKNSVTVQAGEEGGQLATVFQGTMRFAWMDAQAAPRAPFRIEASAGSYESVQPIPPSNTSGSTDVSTTMGQLAKKMGLQFENNGVDTKLSAMALTGSARQQALELAQAAGVEWVIDGGTLAIWKPGQARQGAATTISKDTGLVGYPAFNSKGIIVRTLFQPTLKYGGQISVQSDITPACGTWVIYGMEHDLSSMTPHGPWFTTLYAAQPGQVPVA